MIDEPNRGNVGRHIGNLRSESVSDPGVVVSVMAVPVSVSMSISVSIRAEERAGIHRAGRSVVPAFACLAFVRSHEGVRRSSPCDVNGIRRHSAGNLTPLDECAVLGAERVEHLRTLLDPGLRCRRHTGDEHDRGGNGGKHGFHND